MGKNFVREVLFPTDLSPGSEKIHNHVKGLACTLAARLHVLTVVEPLDSPPFYPPHICHDRSLEDYQDRVLERLERQLKETCAVEFKCLFTIPVITKGMVHRQIIDYAHDNKIDLIIMGTTTRAEPSARLLGNTTAMVVASAKCPVITINPQRTEQVEGVETAYDTDGAKESGK
ncbi:MAG: universal stress protein [Thermodesulfobacteria bacterium]|nr:universal stress protein [Thermodesulfobacteriota bacterium]